MKKDVPKKIMGLIKGKMKAKRQAAKKAMTYGLLMSLIFALPAAYLIVRKLAPTKTVLLMFLIFDLVAFTTTYVLSLETQTITKNERILRRMNR